MAPRVDPDGFGFLITDLARLIRADMDRRIEASGIEITPGEARALVYVASHGEERQNVLAERMGLEAMTLSSYLDRLERHNLVQRVPDPSDGRAKLVRLTDKAEVALETIVRVGAEVRQRARGSMSEEQWHRLIEHLKTARENLSGD